MNCCVNCFSDPGLKNIILSRTTRQGNCDFCEKQDTDIVKCEDLSIAFEALFDLYVNHDTVIKSLKMEKPLLLFEHLDSYWPSLFSSDLRTKGNIKFLIDQIGKGYINYMPEIFEKPVEFRYLVEDAEDPADDLELKWVSFSEEIKFENRYFLNKKPEMELLESIFDSLGIIYPLGAFFYRARISDNQLKLDELGKPPVKYTNGGRANPSGIPYLYISDTEQTTLYEIRVSLHETLTIGKFILKESLKVMTLKDVSLYGPFEIIDKNFEIDNFIKYRPYLLKLGGELSKPVRKQDGTLDYIPTQFLCEFIKSLGFDAVEYKSAMNKGGYNLAVFNDEKLECMEANFYTVKDLEYKWH